MCISNLKVYMFHSPLFLHLSIRYRLIFWNSRLCSHNFYAQPAEPHCSISSISIVMKVKNLQGSLNSWLWHCQCQNTGWIKHIHTAKASSSRWCWLLSFWLLHFITVFYYFFSMFTTIYLYMESTQLRIAEKCNFWYKYAQVRHYLYLKRNPLSQKMK